MIYILVVLFLLFNQYEASDSFDINISAGYSVGLDQSSKNSPPNGTSNISLPKNYYSSTSTSEVKPQANFRSPRVLTNFTPQIAHPVPENPKVQAVPQKQTSDPSYSEYYSAASNNIHSYNSPSFDSSFDKHHGEPNLVDFQKVLSEIEAKKPFSKILQVIKVPAIYEIHLQSENGNDGKNKVNLNPTGDLFWKNYYENKENVTALYSEDYNKWLNNYYMKGEEQFSKDGETYYDFSDTPVVSYEGLQDHPTSDHKLEQHSVYPTRYSHTKAFPHKFKNYKEVRTSHSPEQFNKVQWINKHPRNVKPPNISNFKRHISNNNYIPHTSQTNTIGKPFQSDVFGTYSADLKHSGSFKHNEVITENDKPQALHEVPAPVLGKYPQARPFEIQKESQTRPKFLPTPNPLNIYSQVKFNKVPPTAKPVHFKISNGFGDSKPNYPFGKPSVAVEQEASPSGKQFSSHGGKSNLIYGKKNEHVLTPYEINIPVTPGSTLVTVTERPSNIPKNTFQNFQYPSHYLSSPPMNQDKFHIRHKQLVDSQRIPNFGQKLHYSISSKSDKDDFTTRPLTVESTSNHLEAESDPNQNNSHFQSTTSTYNIINFSSEKPLVSDNKLTYYYQQVVDIPYKKSVNAEDISSTTPSSNTYLFRDDSLTPSTQKTEHIYNQHMEQDIKKDTVDKNVDTNMISSGTTPSFRPKQNFRRRAFNHNYNRDFNSFTKNGYVNKSGAKYSRTFINRRNDPQLDYMIYITRKSRN